MIEKILKIEGMHCKKCVAKVEAALRGIDATNVLVNQEQNEVSVFFENEVVNSLLDNAIRNVGFVVISIQ